MSSFQIPEGPSQVAPGGKAVFSVNNITGEAMRGRLSVRASDGGSATWFALDGEAERLFPAQQSQTASITVRVPPAALPGDYRFCLRVVAVNDPDNDSAESPLVTVTVAPAPPPKPKFPMWAIILIAVLVLAAAAFGVWKLLSRPDGAPAPQASDSSAPQASETPAPVSDVDWFAGTWTGTIDGRPATMRWSISGTGSSRVVTGDFSDGSSGSYVPLKFDSSTGDKLFFRHADGNSWYLGKTKDGEATGWTTWEGRQFPLVMSRSSPFVK